MIRWTGRSGYNLCSMMSARVHLQDAEFGLAQSNGRAAGKRFTIFKRPCTKFLGCFQSRQTRSFMAETEKQAGPRVTFETPWSARIMAIDGTWQRACKIHDVSETSAKLVIDGSINDLGQKEFFLVLSSTGLAYRHCELAWVNGEYVGVQFLNRGRAERRARRGETLVG